MLERDTTEPQMLDELDVLSWYSVYWAEIERRIGPIFARSQARERALSYLAGLLSPAERKNSWQLAEINGDANPYGFQHLLGRADWDADDLRDRLRSYVLDYLATPNAVGVLDETGFVKKGVHSVGVSRQYSGTAGRLENCQIGVFLSYASPLGHTLLDRELYLPNSWTDDRERCRRAGVPDKRSFQTKPELAQQMLERTFQAGVIFAWITGDSVYGDNRALRLWLEERKQSYVLAVSGKETVWRLQQQYSVKVMLSKLPDEGWQRLSAGTGAKGVRWYDWQRLELDEPAQAGFQRWLIVRRSLSDASDLTAYIAFAASGTSLAQQVEVAGTRWTVEESIQTGKGEVGLDHYEVRSWTGWYRHITLAMVAQAFLVVIRAEMGAEEAVKKGPPKPAMPSSLARFKANRGLPVRLSCCEIRRLLWQLVVVVERSAKLILQWSWWRRWHQAWAGFYHRRRQERKLSERAPEQAQGASEPPAEVSGAEPPQDEIEIVWKRLEPLLPPEKRTGRPYEYARRLVLEAIVHVMRTDCGWHNLPAQFPPWQTVYAQYTKWRKTGIWDTIWAGLEQPKPLPR